MTSHTNVQDLRKQETRTAQQHNGTIPKDSEVSALKSMVNENTNKSKEIENHRSNLPLPEQPPTASDWQSADQRTVNVGSGSREGPLSGEYNSALRDPATASSSVRIDGDEWHRSTAPSGNVGRQATENLDGLPKDALSR
ncbi:uncharacterized protein EURHEDRAFT_408400 [Aspergillus ruber CBS 135680]|uniref:Uncharacterized protein n=1 Tax=Aspergillus ruber (strain CBS 135680) TaxID=1388766 RepID=A0A017SQR7_ASPRC|nr:uncharacterized protein EURHEDRAFT_408400 [Aspergillus ruber CBS 135680]EYE99146.1 hypothetical protein EURHEDRAFT_408400 [Aspergillus ruber CBS 135680]